jgi:hypothetical protein
LDHCAKFVFSGNNSDDGDGYEPAGRRAILPGVDGASAIDFLVGKEHTRGRAQDNFLILRELPSQF